jgi:hypothetical protein
MKKIDIFVNGKYAYTTEKFSTVKSAINELKEKKSVIVASIPDYMINITENDKIAGRINK